MQSLHRASLSSATLTNPEPLALALVHDDPLTTTMKAAHHQIGGSGRGTNTSACRGGNTLGTLEYKNVSPKDSGPTVKGVRGGRAPWLL